MKILVSGKTDRAFIDRLQRLAPGLTVDLLRVESREPWLRRGLRKVLGRVLSYGLYQKCSPWIGPRPGYRLLVNGEPLSGPLTGVEVFFAGWDVNKDVFDEIKTRLPDLKWLHSSKTGVEYIDGEYIRSRRILLTNARGVHSGRIAEFVLAVIFEVTKRIADHVEATRRRRWLEIESEELAGKTVGILGVGSIGKAVAQKARALGMRTIGFDKDVKTDKDFEVIYDFLRWTEVLKAADFVVICLPLTKETTGLIGPKELALMKKTAYLINVGRWDIVQEPALVEALKDRKIAGAVLDVYHQGMKNPRHPYYGLDNVVLTHYSAHASAAAWAQITDGFYENCRRYLQNAKLNNIVADDQM